MRVLSLVPTAKAFDADEVHVRIEFLVLGENFLVGRTVVILGGNVLAFVGVEVSSLIKVVFPAPIGASNAYTRASG